MTLGLLIVMIPLFITGMGVIIYLGVRNIDGVKYEIKCNKGRN